MKYCSYCRKELQDDETCNCGKEKETPLAQKIAIWGGAAILLVVALIFGITRCASTPEDPSNAAGSPKLDPFTYIEVDFEGMNGYGSVSVDFDKDSLICELIGEEPNQENTEALSEWLKNYLICEDGIDYEVSAWQNLSNGDIVTVTVTAKKALEEKVSVGSKQYVVSDLDEPVVVDLFEQIHLAYEGVSGEARARVVKLTDSDVLSACSFAFSSYGNLSNGDEVTVFIENADSLAASFGVFPKEISRTYTVQGLSSYVSSADQIPLDVIEQIATLFLEEKRQELQYDGYFTYDEITYQGAFFYLKKGGESARYENILRFDVSYDRYMHGELLRTEHTYLDFVNVLIDSAGTVMLNYEEGTQIMIYDPNDYALTTVTL